MFPFNGFFAGAEFKVNDNIYLKDFENAVKKVVG